MKTLKTIMLIVGWTFALILAVIWLEMRASFVYQDEQFRGMRSQVSALLAEDRSISKATLRTIESAPFDDAAALKKRIVQHDSDVEAFLKQHGFGGFEPPITHDTETDQQTPGTYSSKAADGLTGNAQE